MSGHYLDDVKNDIKREVERLHNRLIDISQTLHANPEIAFEEYRAAEVLTSQLSEHGFDIETGVAGIDTAFVATYGEGEPVVGILAEYDALPQIGHACGHNLIATWAIGAGIALRRALPDLKGTIKVIGTPGEEDGGGKVIMAEQGVFNGLSAAMMMHPRDRTFLDRGSLALTPYTIEFFGRPAHASSSPEEGINALDAMLQLFNGINALRQGFKPHTRIHGIISHGGDASNVIPEYTKAEILVRANDQSYLEELRERFENIVRAAALATGARSKVTRGVSYKQRVSNTKLVETFGDNLTALGFDHETADSEMGVGSSDIGDVSQLVPTIHPYLKIAEVGTGGHTQAFAEASSSDLANDLTVSGATMLAWAAADVLLRSELREQLRETFRTQLGREPQF